MSRELNPLASGASALLPVGKGNLGKNVLTPRQTQILRGIIWGKTAGEIGRWLGISPRAIEIYRSQILLRIGARNGADATRLALLAGFNFGPEPSLRGSEGKQDPSIPAEGEDDGICFDHTFSAPAGQAAHGAYRPCKVSVNAAARVIGFQDAD